MFAVVHGLEMNQQRPPSRADEYRNTLNANECIENVNVTFPSTLFTATF
jgi:hypothetical protein